MSYAVPNRQEVMSEELSQEIFNVKAIGSEIYNALKQEIFTIHRTNIKGLNTIQKNRVHKKANTKDGSWICLQTNCRYHNSKVESIKIVSHIELLYCQMLSIPQVSSFEIWPQRPKLLQT